MAEPANDVSQASPDLSTSPDVAASSAATGTVTPQGDSPEGVIAQPSDQAKVEVDPLEGVPTLEELQGKENVPYAKAVAQLRSAYEPLKQQYDELSTKHSVFEPVADKLQTAEEVQSLVTLNESLNKYSPDPDTGALRPDPTGFAQQMSTDDPERADYLTSALVWGQTKHPVSGQPVTRAELVLQVMANDPQLRSHALQVLGGVEPSAVPAPTWTPSQEELDRLVNDPDKVTAEERALQERYRKLPYEDRLELLDRTPEFVKNTLRTLQQNELLQANEERRVAAEQRAEVETAQRVEQEANDAGDQYVEQGFKGTFTNFANHIYETWKPTDNPEVNKREGALVALAVAALSTPDTRFAAEQAFKEMGINQKVLDEFNAAREAYAQSGREFGYLTHKKQRTNGDPSRSQQKLLAKAKDLGTLIIAGRNEYFKTRATTHNDNLDQTERARIPVGAGVAAVGANGQPRHRWADMD
jgi:hypothetical protein